MTEEEEEYAIDLLLLHCSDVLEKAKSDRKQDEFNGSSQLLRNVNYAQRFNCDLQKTGG